MFDKTANFSSLFDSTQPQRISDVKHKAFLDVNEAGSEAAAATCKNQFCRNYKNIFIYDFFLIFFRCENRTHELEFRTESIPC